MCNTKVTLLGQCQRARQSMDLCLIVGTLCGLLWSLQVAEDMRLTMMLVHVTLYILRKGDPRWGWSQWLKPLSES